jgi:hypothetical protein
MALAQFSAQPLYVSAGTTVTVATTGAAGSPAPALALRTGTMTGYTDYAYTAGFLYGAFTYDPGSQGAITSLDFSLDRALDFVIDGSPIAASITGRVLIQQGGQTYMAVSAGVPAPGTAFTTITMNGLLATDFGLWDTATNAVNAALNPDFASGPMTFGFAVRASANNWLTTTTVQLDAYADNFRLALNTAAVPVPVPATLALALLGLAAMGVAGRRRA